MRVDITRVDTRSTPTATAMATNTTVGDFIQALKSGIYPPFNKRIWQRNYYDHIIRNEKDYQSYWQYIDENPAR